MSPFDGSFEQANNKQWQNEKRCPTAKMMMMMMMKLWRVAITCCLLAYSMAGCLAFQQPRVGARSWAHSCWPTNHQRRRRRNAPGLFADSSANSSSQRWGDDDEGDDDEIDEDEKAYGNRSLSWTNRYRKLLPYEYARNRVMSWGLRSKEEYQAEIKGPYLPRRPEEMYASDWISWEEFLGVMRPYEDAQHIVQNVLRLSSKEEYDIFVQTDKKRAEGLRIPAKPHIVYKNKGWKSFDHFFGIKNSTTCRDDDDESSGAQSHSRFD